MKSHRANKALKLTSDTKALEIGAGVINQVAKLFKEQFPGKEAIIIADATTYKVAGEEVFKQLNKGGVSQLTPIIIEDKNLYAEYSFVTRLAEALKKHNAIPLAVGSGTINDLVKLSSYQSGRRYMCIATAASMDGYTAFGASITANGAKQTFSCPAPQACIADIDIISKAPAKMTAAGYADLAAKITAGADWIVADALGEEPINQTAWEIVQDGLHDALSNPEGVARGDQEAIWALTESLLLGGFAMQSTQSSRPASGAEHQFSHLWNMEHHSSGGEVISHGFQVAIGTLSVLALYEEILKYPIEEFDVDKACEAWPSAEATREDALAQFKGSDFPHIGEQETAAKYISKERLREQLTEMKNNWGEIKKRIATQLISFEQMTENLKMVGAPTKPEDIGISREYLKETYIRAQYIRRRFTVLDFALRMNMLEPWVDSLFSEGGAWNEKTKVRKVSACPSPPKPRIHLKP